MGYSIFWTRRASSDIESIYRFYEAIAGKIVAKRRLQRIKQGLSCLMTMPHIGPIDNDFSHTPCYRYLVVLDYRVYYFVEEHVVYIAAIWDCRRMGKALDERNTIK